LNCVHASLLRQVFCTCRNDDDCGVSLAATVHSAEPLDHSLPGDEVRDHVVRVEVDTDLSRRRSNHECRLIGFCAVARKEAVLFEPLGRLLAFVNSAAADEQLRMASPGPLASSFEAFLNFLGVVAPIAKDYAANWSCTRARKCPRGFSQRFRKLL